MIIQNEQSRSKVSLFSLNRHLWSTRKTFLRVAGMITGSSLVSSCLPGLLNDENKPEQLPAANLDDIRYLEFNNSPFKEGNESKADIITEFGFGKYRVIEIKAENLKPYNPLPNDIQLQSAEQAVYSALHQYAKIIQVQKCHVNEETGQKTWKPLHLAGSPSDNDSLNQILTANDKVLASEWIKSSTNKDIATNLLHKFFYDSTLDDTQRAGLIQSLVLPEYQASAFDALAALKKTNKPQIDAIPANLPLAFMADIHNSLNLKTTNDKYCLDIFSAISAGAGVADCIFIPKIADEDYAQSIDHAIKKEFFELPPKPRVYYVKTHSPDGSTVINKHIFVTHNDQSEKDYYNHDFDAPSNLDHTEFAAEQYWVKVEPDSKAAKNLLDIHKIVPDSTHEVWELLPTGLKTHLIPNKFTGSPNLKNEDANVRIAHSLTFTDPIEQKEAVLLFGRKTRDMFFPSKLQDSGYNSWPTDVTDSMPNSNLPDSPAPTHMSKLGMLTPLDFFHNLFMGLAEDNGGIIRQNLLKFAHKSMVPSHPFLKELMMDMFIDAQLHNTNLKHMNWAFGTGKPVPIYQLKGKNIAQFWNDIGRATKFRFWQDKFEYSQIQDTNGQVINLMPGEALAFGKMFVDATTNERWIMVGRVQKDDDNGLFARLKNFALVDEIDTAFAIKWTDAIKHICPIDDDNNILDAIKSVVTIGGTALIILLTLYAPEVLPTFALATSLKISSKYNLLISLIKTAIFRTP